MSVSSGGMGVVCTGIRRIRGREGLTASAIALFDLMISMISHVDCTREIWKVTANDFQ